MKKAWSITTTLRNPERLRSFLSVLKQMDGEIWDKDSQCKYQILLIKERVYGYGKKQFYNGLSNEYIDLIDNSDKTISFEVAKKIFEMKNYEDPAMRGRQSLNPLKKIGLVVLNDNKIKITSLGFMFLKDDFDLGNIFFRSFIKWQIPNPISRDYKYEDGYNIKPFIGILHLINYVNKKCRELNIKEKGISKKEFSLFGPTLVHFDNIKKYGDKIIEIRENLSGIKGEKRKELWEKNCYDFAKDFLGVDEEEKILRFLETINDYGDNAIRYFRLTRFIYIRGGGFYIDLEPRRSLEIQKLLSYDNSETKKFKTQKEYLDYISNISEPILPWENEETYKKILSSLFKEIRSYEEKLNLSPTTKFDISKLGKKDLEKKIIKLRQYRRTLQNKENHLKSQSVKSVQNYISKFENIFKNKKRPILLEQLSALSLHALNDALMIKPNYPVGDDNEPTFTAPANIPDIECYYKTYNAICEVTMLNSRDQWYNEGQPVMRHLRDFENKHCDKKAYCLFIAPKIHRDTLNTFWSSVKYEYEGRKQHIIPLTIENFVQILKSLILFKESQILLSHIDIEILYHSILNNVCSCDSSDKWLKSISKHISIWKNDILENKRKI